MAYRVIVLFNFVKLCILSVQFSKRVRSRVGRLFHHLDWVERETGESIYIVQVITTTLSASCASLVVSTFCLLAACSMRCCSGV